ncbi:MAG: aspartate aminotransferase family protein, partial [Polyangiales bacterium]
FTTADGERWLDMAALVYQVSAGHGHRRIVDAVKAQADELAVTLPNAVYPRKTELARELLSIAPEGFSKVFFTLGGADANENALKIARMFTGRHKVITRYRSYHGATMGAISLSGDWRRPPVEPGLPGVVHVADFDCEHCPSGVRGPECDHEPLTRIPRAMELEGNIGAVFVEPVVGGNGVLIPPPGYMQRLREACDAHGALLVADEVLTGFGRTGRWLAQEHFGVVPDMITCGKALTGGYGTLGAVLVHDRIARYFDEHTLVAGLTGYAHPLGVAAALEAIHVYRDERLVERAAELESVLRDGLARTQAKHRPITRQSRVIGLLSATELDVDDRQWAKLGAALRERRVLTHMVIGRPGKGQDKTLVLSPPLCISEDELSEGLDEIDLAIGEALR